MLFLSVQAIRFPRLRDFILSHSKRDYQDQEQSAAWYVACCGRQHRGVVSMETSRARSTSWCSVPRLRTMCSLETLDTFKRDRLGWLRGLGRLSAGWRCILHCVFFERWFLDLEELQTHHIWQFLVTFQRCRVTNIRVIGGIEKAR